ncbi:MAG: ubiquinol-cytochrome c reductase iron-sulfur subunit [Acidobacteriaceae bacterium]
MKNPLKDLFNNPIVKNPLNEPSEYSRRRFLFKVAVGLNGIVGVVLAVPVVWYIFAPAFRGNKSYNHWVPVGDLDQFPPGETRLGRYRNPDGTPADGATRTLPCWVRHIEKNQFQVFAINCAHMDCPVHWFPQSKLFMCPCHGGIYYQDGAVAAGPPPRGLYQYKYKVVGKQLMIWAGELPTLSTEASIARPGCTSCQA